MGASIRLLIADPVVGWRRLPMPKAMQVYRGESCLPEFASKTVAVATATVQVERQKVARLVHLERLVWSFDYEGRIDLDAVHAGILRKLNNDGSEDQLSGGTTFSEDDICAIRRVLGLEGT